MKKIIGFAGRKRSGKTMLSNCIKEIDNKVILITIANYLKELCCKILDIDRVTLNEWKDNGHILNIRPTQRWYNLIHKTTGISVNDIESNLDNIIFKDIRHILQFIGTDIIRKYNPEWHVNSMITDINSYSDDYTIVIDDVRFPNELNAIKKLGGEVFFIIRPNFWEISNHESETALKWSNFEHTNIIINDLPKETVLDFFKIWYTENKHSTAYLTNPIISENNKNFIQDCNIYFPFDDEQVDLAYDIIKQNKNNIRFIKNGIIQYIAPDRTTANAFVDYVNQSCSNWKRLFVIYNPFINENLKQFFN